jgi:hypothetical protein
MARSGFGIMNSIGNGLLMRKSKGNTDDSGEKGEEKGMYTALTCFHRIAYFYRKLKY